MRASFLAAVAVSLLTTTALAQTPPPAKPAIVTDANAPKGRLSDAAVPKAYRLDFTILPETDTFSGHDEIDVTLKVATKSLYLHGRSLTVTKAVAMVGGKAVPATFTQVDDTGTARLDFASTLPAGAATLVFDYTGPFGDSASGLFHVKSATPGTAGRSSKASMRAPPIQASTSRASRRRSPSRSPRTPVWSWSATRPRYRSPRRRGAWRSTSSRSPNRCRPIWSRSTPGRSRTRRA